MTGACRPTPLHALIAKALRSVFSSDDIVDEECIDEQAAAVRDALLAEGFHAWRRSPGSFLQTEPMMGYPERTEHFLVMPLVWIDARTRTRG